MFTERLNAISMRLNQLIKELTVEKKNFNFLAIYELFEHLFDLQLQIAEHCIQNNQPGSAFVLLSHLNKINPNHRQARRILQTLKPPFANEKKGAEEASSLVRSVLNLHQACINGMVDISEDYLAHGQGCQAKTLLTYVTKLSPNHEKAKKHLAMIIGQYDDFLLRHDLVSENYQTALNNLKLEHQKATRKNVVEQLEWLDRLFTFIHTNYQWKDGAFTFIEAGYLQQTEEGRKRRSHVNDFLLNMAMLKQGAITVTPPDQLNLSEVDEASLFWIKNVSSDIYFDDLIYCLRMVFETIHQLPRELRTRYSDKLPWGDSSWFYLEFLGALFFTNEQSLLKYSNVFVYTHDDSPEYNTRLTNFHESIKAYLCLVKIVALDLMKVDLPVLHHFFRELHQQENNGHPNPDAVKPTPPLNTVTIALDYFRKSFNLFRLTGLMPYRPGVNLMEIQCEAYHPQRFVSKLTPYSLFQIQNKVPVNAGLKGSYSFLRRVMLIGEMFTNRSWGSDVRSLGFVAPKVLSDIRNGLCHLEQLQSDALVDELEKETTIKLLHNEFVKLRGTLLHFIAERQGRFAPFISITEDAMYTKWSAQGHAYWDSVKQVYAEDHSSFNDQEFIPDEPLLDASMINHLIKSLKKDTPEEISYQQNVRDQLEGKRPFNIDRIEDHLNNDSLDPRWVKTVKKHLDQAKKKYSQLRLAEVKKVSAENDRLENEIREKQESAMKKYPNMALWSDKLCKELDENKQEAAKPKQQQVKTLIQRLKKRIGKLQLLLSESQLRFDSTETLSQQRWMIEKFKTLINDDIDMFFACSYLAAQIIAMVNELTAYREIKSPVSEERLKEWVALRNCLMHADSIIESAEMSFSILHFHKLPDTMCYFILEFIATCQEPFMTMDLANLPVDYAEAKPIKQEKPVNWDSFLIMFNQLMEQRPNRLPVVLGDELEPIEPMRQFQN